MKTAAVQTRTGSNTQGSVKLHFGDVPPDKVFYCVNGDVYRNLYELYLGLSRMNVTDFLCHRRDDTNEFSEWIRVVFGDKRLAEAMRRPRLTEVQEALREALTFSLPGLGSKSPRAAVAQDRRVNRVNAQKNTMDVALGV